MCDLFPVSEQHATSPDALDRNYFTNQEQNELCGLIILCLIYCPCCLFQDEAIYVEHTETDGCKYSVTINTAMLE